MSWGSAMKQKPLLRPGIVYPSGTGALEPLRRYSRTAWILESSEQRCGTGRLPTSRMEVLYFSSASEVPLETLMEADRGPNGSQQAGGGEEDCEQAGPTGKEVS
ncbi:hypothetical protein MHYP_G00132370 [Metynnis hypsauchen]